MLTRIVTGVLAAALVLAAVLFREPWGALALVWVIAVVGSAELVGLKGVHWAQALPSLSLPLLIVLWPSFNTGFIPWLTVFWAAGAVSLFVWKPNKLLEGLGLFFWLATGCVCLLLLQTVTVGNSAPFAPNLLLLALLPLWVGDSLAYFIGRAFGKHKFAPSISPNKTWEGAAANLVGCLAAAYGIALWLGIPAGSGIAVGLTTGIIGQIGDLLQSRIKRVSGVKDSGSILPGHGGVLDRLDSFLLSSYPSLLALYLTAPGLFHVKQWP